MPDYLITTTPQSVPTPTGNVNFRADYGSIRISTVLAGLSSNSGQLITEGTTGSITSTGTIYAVATDPRGARFNVVAGVDANPTGINYNNLTIPESLFVSVSEATGSTATTNWAIGSSVATGYTDAGGWEITKDGVAFYGPSGGPLVKFYPADESTLTQTLGNANATITNGKTRILLNATLTATRTFTLPDPANYKAGTPLSFVDTLGGISPTFNAILYAGAGTVNGGSSMVLSTPYASPILVSDGATKWTLDIRGVTRGGTGATTAAGARTNLGLGTGDSPTFAGVSTATVSNSSALSLVGGASVTTLTLSASYSGLYMLGGGSSSYPALRQSGANINFVLADVASGFTNVGAAGFLTGSTATGTAGFKSVNSTRCGIWSQNAQVIHFWNDNVLFGGSTGVGWVSSGAPSSEAPDLYLYRDAAATLAQRNGTNAQTFRVYNTYSDASNYERGILEWASNRFTIGTGFAGTGASRTLDFQVGNTKIFRLETTGDMLWVTDNTYNIGAFGANRPKDIYAGGIINANGELRAGNGFLRISTPASGVAFFGNSTSTDFNRIQLGGTTSSFPAVARDGAGIKIVGADGTSVSWIKVPPVAFASLPSAVTAGNGAKAHVTDAVTQVFGATIAVGGGSISTPVYSDGSVWKIG